jgi:hypothetical protein
MLRRGTLLSAGGVLAIAFLAACELARPLHPAPAPAPTTALVVENRDEVLDALLQAHTEATPGDVQTTETFRHLFAAMGRVERGPDAAAGSPRPSAAVEQGLRELRANPGDAQNVRRVLQRVMAEQNPVQATPDERR